jgi:hypothetical protein
MAAHNSPMLGLFKPRPTRKNTVMTKALESGFQSEMPWEIPLTRTKRKERATAARSSFSGCSITE